MDAERRRRMPRRRGLGLRGARSFALGGLVGAAGAFAAARRLRVPPRGPAASGGLEAFEDAPCYLEHLEREAGGYREGGGDTGTGRSNPE